MPFVKLGKSGTHNAMKSEEGNDYLDTLIRQAICKEPLLHFQRTGDAPVQGIQLFHALDHPDFPGWPLVTPVKVQMQKCDKCSQEFCSSINYRRHIRVHRRSLNINKESHKIRDLLAAFWDKLSLEKVKEVVSFDDVLLKEIPGSSIIRALASSLLKPGVWTLPQVYVKAGSTLLDIIQFKPSRLPISSEELFSVLNDASERTFLCAGMAESLQKYVFDREAAKNSLELKNLIASTSFLFEQKVVKAWVADKDEEALRCQKILVEEEEAAQKRQAVLLERKRQKKLRQKQQKVKEQFYGCNKNFNAAVDASDGPVLAEASGSSSSSNSCSNSVYVPVNHDCCIESMQFQSKESDIDMEAQIYFNSECDNQGDPQNIESQMVDENGHRHFATSSWQVSESQTGYYGFRLNQDPEFIQKIGLSKDQTLLNGSKFCTKGHEMEVGEESLKPLLLGESGQMVENNCEVIVGSIPITLSSYVAQQQRNPDDDREACSTECAVLELSALEKLRETDAVQSSTNHVASKYWRTVTLRELNHISPGERGNQDSEGAVTLSKDHDQIISSERCVQSQSADNNDCDDQTGENAQQGYVLLSSAAAKEFLGQRWKEVILADHVQLALSVDGQHNCSTASNTSDLL